MTFSGTSEKREPLPNRTFGRTSSRMSRAEQARLEERLAAFTPVVKSGKIDLEATFPGLSGPLVVELGIGKGELLLTRAEANPSQRYLGVEVYKNGLRSLVGRAEKVGLTNLKIVGEDAREVLTRLPEGSVDELLLLYPDPWPKKRHNKRRLVRRPFLEAADRVLKENGTLLLTTDIPDYALWMLREVAQHGVFFPFAHGPEEWAVPPAWWHPTRYEQKAKKLGRKPWYLLFGKNVEQVSSKCKM